MESLTPVVAQVVSLYVSFECSPPPTQIDHLHQQVYPLVLGSFHNLHPLRQEISKAGKDLVLSLDFKFRATDTQMKYILTTAV